LPRGSGDRPVGFEPGAELQRRGIDPARPVIIAVEPDDWIAKARRFARPLVEADGQTDDDIDRMIKKAQREVEPRLG
jgi:hypothetical protein